MKALVAQGLLADQQTAATINGERTLSARVERHEVYYGPTLEVHLSCGADSRTVLRARSTAGAVH
jgi:hypothetical protein